MALDKISVSNLTLIEMRLERFRCLPCLEFETMSTEMLV